MLGWCRPLHADDAFWTKLRGAVTGLERREPIAARLERLDGSVLDCTTVPLPDGATLVTFQDVTDSVNVERALTERADALQDADRLKSAFVQHVSYELRTPLTNIIGFAHLLLDPHIGPTIGPITEKQRDYLDSIDKSSSALLAIINDILDLTTIDAGAMPLDLKEVDIRAAVDAAALGLQDRIAEKAILLDVRAASDIGSFVADERRVRQVLFNLLSNAISFSPAAEVVRLTVERRDDAVVFSVTDRGPGIPAEISERVFDRFESHALGSEHRGAGLGLSIVRSFVELHGGTVKLDSAVGRGTTVTCVFPIRHADREAADVAQGIRRLHHADAGSLTFFRLLDHARERARDAAPRGRYRGGAEARRSRHAVGRPRRRQDRVRARADPPSRRRCHDGGAEPDLHAGADLCAAALHRGACRSLSRHACGRACRARRR